jgi:hypothetical protein
MGSSVGEFRVMGVILYCFFFLFLSSNKNRAKSIAAFRKKDWPMDASVRGADISAQSVYFSKPRWDWELLEIKKFIIAKNRTLGGFIRNSWRCSKNR